MVHDKKFNESTRYEATVEEKQSHQSPFKDHQLLSLRLEKVEGEEEFDYSRNKKSPERFKTTPERVKI